MITDQNPTAVTQLRQVLDHQGEQHNTLFTINQALGLYHRLVLEMAGSPWFDTHNVGVTGQAILDAMAKVSDLMTEVRAEWDLTHDQLHQAETVPVNLPILDGDGEIIGWYDPQIE